MAVQIPLGRTGIEVSALGIGTWAWGERLWGYGSSYSDPDLQEAFRVALAEGITLFDTAEIYGWGRSEQLLGRFIAESGATASGDPATSDAPRPRVVVATKFMPYPWRLTRASLLRALRRSLQRLGLQQVDLYQVHWPFPPVPADAWMDHGRRGAGWAGAGRRRLQLRRHSDAAGLRGPRSARCRAGLQPGGVQPAAPQA
ncbi:aldo/keto reductase [Geochorda subterranea]|uniref:Aldo/keto reductase n=1 Tax=Geochorda subterranea TaxID=3109564 RepID=A0ABZ1BP53_9FIRM|nr:aldo/keto reductase [Limnochorda sp. LNt]WRP14582.1 aldo/keto reductase [Limnochorda sp. LNt]